MKTETIEKMLNFLLRQLLKITTTTINNNNIQSQLTCCLLLYCYLLFLPILHAKILRKWQKFAYFINFII